MTRLVGDVANYTPDLMPIVPRWHELGVKEVIIRAPNREDAHFASNRQIALNQLQVINTQGFIPGTYTWSYWGDPKADIEVTLELFSSGFGPMPSIFWFDCEYPGDRMMILNYLDGMLGWTNYFGIIPGIYTRPSWWREHVGNSLLLRDVLLWYANPDGVADFSDWDSMQFGGWKIPYGKQYNLDVPEASGHVDYSVFRDTIPGDEKYRALSSAVSDELKLPQNHRSWSRLRRTMSRL